MVTGTFKILIDGVVRTYARVSDIPEHFENVIAFKPDYPDPPHTEEDHALMETYNNVLHELLKRERNASSHENR